MLMDQRERGTFSASRPPFSASRRLWTYAVRRIKSEILPRYPNVDDVVAITHTYGCGVAIDAPGAAIPIRTIRNLTYHPNIGGRADDRESRLRETPAAETLSIAVTRYWSRMASCGSKIIMDLRKLLPQSCGQRRSDWQFWIGVAGRRVPHPRCRSACSAAEAMRSRG